MVHKKYIRKNGKLYGPYYYESYREDGKIKKRYVKRDNKIYLDKKFLSIKAENILYIVFFIFLTLTMASYFLPSETFDNIFSAEFLFSPPSASTGTNENAELTIWDETDEFVKRSGENFLFYANYTKLSDGSPIIDVEGNCQIRFDYTGDYTPFEVMVYNPSSELWEITKSFNYKGSHEFEIDCTSTEGDIILQNTFVITNTIPEFIEEGTTVNGIEDDLIVEDFKTKVYEPDVNDVLTFSIVTISSSQHTSTNPDYYYWIWIDPLTGELIINATLDNETGLFDIAIDVVDESGDGESRSFFFDVTPRNDPPYLVNMSDKEFNRSFIFEEYFDVFDEESDYPASLSITYIGCDTADWSTRNDVDCDLFMGQYIFNGTLLIINFTPEFNDVGMYEINFSLTDSRGAVQDIVVNFTVLNINSAPYFTYLCDLELLGEAIEDSEFSCYINASDIDEINNLTFFGNYSWFLNYSIDIGMFNFSTLINFIPTDSEVGNWDINISIEDTGGLVGPVLLNSSVINLVVNNAPDNVFLDEISDVVVYTSNSLEEIFVNASDEDLLIPDKTVYDESISFSTDYSGCVFAESYNVVEDTNLTTSRIYFNPSDNSCFLGGQNYEIEITAEDATGNQDIQIFRIMVEPNSPPEWSSLLETEYDLTEDIAFFINLSDYVTDADLDTLIFSHDAVTEFPDIETDTGVIDFIPSDLNIGVHVFNISVTDGITPSILEFKFEVNNINDQLMIEFPLSGNNIIDDAHGNLIVYEDSEVDIFLFVQDDDALIPEEQSNFYKESFEIITDIQGPNPSLLENVFSDLTLFDGNRSQSIGSFISSKADIGLYSIYITVNDSFNSMDEIQFNLTIVEINHAPSFINLTNQSAKADYNLYYDIESEDIEDGEDDLGLLTYSYEFLTGNDFINFDPEIFNTQSGVFNYTFSEGEEGIYVINVTSSDSGSPSLSTSRELWIFVYSKPLIQTPNTSFLFEFIEGQIEILTFMANHSIQDDLNYSFYLDSEFKGSFIGPGNNSNFTWIFTPDYADETYGEIRNLTLIVSNPVFSDLNDIRDWDANVSHSNAPVTFFNDIGDKEANFGTTILVNLTNHFFDSDAFDPVYNQTVDFYLIPVDGETEVVWEINDWILSLSSSKETSDIFTIEAFDLDNEGNNLTGAVSNEFEIKFTEPRMIQTPTPSSGGGSGGSGKSSSNPVSLRIIVPGPITAKQGDSITIPLKLVNEGQLVLNKIDLSTIIAKDEIIRDDIKAVLDKVFIESLGIGASESLTLTVNLPEEFGLFEINLGASVQDPRYLDEGKILININEGKTITERLVFTAELIAEKPECVELTELVNEAYELYNNGDTVGADAKLEEALNSCKKAISQQAIFSRSRFRERFQSNVFFYLLITTITTLIIGIGYYAYKRFILKKALDSAEKLSTESSSLT